jgi:hypothetical protein
LSTFRDEDSFSPSLLPRLRGLGFILLKTAKKTSLKKGQKLEKESSQVEISAEPRIESRFGFSHAKKRKLPPALTKFLIIGTVLSVGVVFWLKEPAPSEQTESKGLKTPEPYEIGAPAPNLVEVSQYSANQERSELEVSRKNRKQPRPLKLPGLQKFLRQRASGTPAGAELMARLITTATNGLVKAEALNTLKMNGDTFVRAGEILMGRGQSTEELLLVHFTKLIHSDGSTESIDAEAADAEDRSIGLRGKAISRYAAKYAAAIGLNFVGGMTEVLQDRTNVGQQAVPEPSAKNALLSGTGRATLEMANETMAGIRNKPSVIAVEAGREILIVFTGDSEK